MRVDAWLKERIPPLEKINDFLRQKSVPRHKYSFFYIFGGLSLFLFFVQLITGILLALYYSPTPENANESVKIIINEVSFGWLIRSIHVWGANFMVAAVLIHMFSTYFMKAYRNPREMMWLSGSLLLFMILGFAFTGYLLPWDTTAYFATLIGTEIPKSIPIVGEIMVKVLRGGEEVGAEALKRLFAIHAIILPVISTLIILFHVILQQILGTSVPLNTNEQLQPIPFFPNYVYRDVINWTIVFLIILGCSTMIPPGLGEKADPFASAPVGIKPEWYFLPLFQSLRIVPATILSFNSEMLVNMAVLLGSIFWLMIPFLDRKAERGEKSGIFQLLGILLIVYCSATIVLAYLA